NQGVGNLTGNTDHMNIGNKIIGNFLFEQKDKEDGTEYEVGYLSPGHNSVYQEEKTGQLFLVFHTRFPNRGEEYELRIHQMIINEVGGPLVPPNGYVVKNLKSIDPKEIIVK